MVLLVALAKSQGVPPRPAAWSPPRSLPGGALFFTGPHAINNSRPVRPLWPQDPQALIANGSAALGRGEPMRRRGRGRIKAAQAFPLAPIYALVWAVKTRSLRPGRWWAWTHTSIITCPWTRSGP